MNTAAGSSLPLEIWTHIFNLACTDGGFTGCSLSRVSRSVRATSAPIRYRTIVLAGPDQISGFSALLKETPGPSVRRVIRNLFLFRHEPASQDAIYRRPRGPSMMVQQARLSRRNGVQDPMAVLPSAVEHILEVAAPTLRTVGISEFYWRAKLNFHTSLPVLNTITHFGPFQLTDMEARPLFEEISSIHLVVGNVRKEIIVHLGSMAPRLTHLTITMAFNISGCFSVDDWLDFITYSTAKSPAPLSLRDLLIFVARGKEVLREDGRWLVEYGRTHIVKGRLGWRAVSGDESSQTRECRRVGMLHDWLENVSGA